MDTGQLLDLFTMDTEKKKGKPSAQQQNETGKASLKSMMENLGELWDEEQYETEYNLDNFIESLKWNEMRSPVWSQLDENYVEAWRTSIPRKKKWRFFKLAHFVPAGKTVQELNSLYFRYKRKTYCHAFTFSEKLWFSKFSVTVMQCTAKKCTNARAESLYCLLLSRPLGVAQRVALCGATTQNRHCILICISRCRCRRLRCIRSVIKPVEPNRQNWTTNFTSSVLGEWLPTTSSNEEHHRLKICFIRWQVTKASLAQSYNKGITVIWKWRLMANPCRHYPAVNSVSYYFTVMDYCPHKSWS